MLLIVSISSFSQQTDPPQTLTKQDYLQKSKNKKKIAWIFLGGGAVLIATGAIIPAGDLTDQFNIYTGAKDIHENDAIKGALIVGGGLSMLASIPFFIASGKNKRKAMSVSFKNETAPQFLSKGLVTTNIPCLSLKIGL